MEILSNIAKTLQTRILAHVSNSQNAHLWALGTLCLIAAQMCVFAFLTSQHPYVAEIVSNTMISIGVWINVGLAAGAILCTVAALAWNFGKGVTVSATFSVPTPGMLQSGYSAPTVNPDVLVVPLPGETPEDFSARVISETGKATPKRWVVVLRFRERLAAIYTGGADAIVFTRDTGPESGWPWAGRMPDTNTLFTQESERDFQNYVNTFATLYNEWAPAKKAELAKGRAGNVTLEILAPSAKFSASALLILFALLPASAQKTRAVAETLGRKAAEIPAQNVRVEYNFERSEVARIGDGRRNYSELLSAVPGFRNSDAGKCVSVISDGAVIARAAGVEAVAASAIRPHSETREPAALPTLPDSVTMAEMAERAKFEIWKFGETTREASRPWWEVLMFAFWTALPFLLIVGALSYFAAYVAAREGMHDLHRAARRVLVYDSLAAVGVLLLNGMLYAIYAGFSPFALFATAIAEIFVASRLVSWLVPDFRPAAGNAPRGQYFDRNTPQLGA